jgi:hypothetical protein
MVRRLLWDISCDLILWRSSSDGTALTPSCSVPKAGFEPTDDMFEAVNTQDEGGRYAQDTEDESGKSYITPGRQIFHRGLLGPPDPLDDSL